MSTINVTNAKELGRKGGIRSGQVRRERKEMKETLQIIMSLPFEGGRVADSDKAKNFKDLNKQNLTVGERMMVEVVKRAEKGDMTAVYFIRDTLGEKPKDEVEVSTIQVPKFEGEDELED